MRGSLAGAVIMIVAAVPTPAAAIEYISQFRSLDATASGSPVHKENSALGSWTETASIAQITLAFPPVVIASGFASQTSDLLDKLITSSGSLNAISGNFNAGSGRSELSLEFLVDSPSPYFSTLSTTGATQTSIGASAGWNPMGSGILAPGTYSLSVVFDVATDGGSSGSGTYLYSLSIVPEPATAILILLGGLLVAAQRTGRR